MNIPLHRGFATQNTSCCLMSTAIASTQACTCGHTWRSNWMEKAPQRTLAEPTIKIVGMLHFNAWSEVQYKFAGLLPCYNGWTLITVYLHQTSSIIKQRYAEITIVPLKPGLPCGKLLK